MNALQVLKDRKIMGSMASIAVPIALQNLITYMTSMMDTVMLGQLGEVALSGASLAGQVGTVFMVLSFGIASGTNILVSQYWGKGDTASIRSILAIMYRVTCAVALVFIVAAWFFPARLLSIFSNDPEVIAAGAGYLKLVCLSYFFNGMANVMLMTLRSVGTVGISIVVYVTSLFVNTFLNWVLIFGQLGFPRLEMEGAAIATIIARAVEFSIAVVYILKFEKKIRMTLKDLLHYDRSFLRDYGVNVVPVMCNELIWSLGNSMLLVVMGRMGRDFVSANSIANVTNQFVQVFIVGVSNAASVIIGNTIGAEEYDKAKAVAKAMMLLALGLGIVAGLLFFAVRPVVVGFYNIPEATKVLAMDVMAVASLLTFFQSLTFIGMMGILRGGGDTRFVLVCDVVFLWCLSIPLGFFTGLVLGWPAPAVYLILKGDEVLKIASALLRIWSGKWVRNLTR